MCVCGSVCVCTVSTTFSILLLDFTLGSGVMQLFAYLCKLLAMFTLDYFCSTFH